MRLPTGRREDLLGSGTTAMKFSGIGSIDARTRRRRTRTPASASAGSTNEISYGGAVTYAATGRVSVVGELLGRWLDSPGHIVPVSAPHPRLTACRRSG